MLPPTASLRIFWFLACLSPSMALAADAVVDRSVTRAAFLQLIERARVPLAAESRVLDASNGIVRTYFTFMSEAGERVPGLWYQRSNVSTRLPVVILLHGTGGTKEGMKELLEIYAQVGFAAIAIDGRHHGERAATGKGSADYQAAILRAYRNPGQEHPFFFDTVWDVMRLVDYLETREDLDPKRIGLMGISRGGIETYLTAAADSRIAVAVPCIGVESFHWALEHNAWQSRIGTIQTAADAAAKDAGVNPIDAHFIHEFYARVAPGLDGEFDGPAMLPLIAPRPLLIINGDSDARTPLPGVQECLTAARPFYQAANAEDRLKFIPEKNTAHKVTDESYHAALAWFELWLKPKPNSSSSPH